MKKTRLITTTVLALCSFVSVLAEVSLPMPNFSHVFHTLQVNRAVYGAYQDSIHSDLSDDEWIAFFYRRAARHQQMYAENNQAIDAVAHYFAQDKSLIEPAAYDSLFSWTKHMFANNYDDTFLLDELSHLLLPHYEALADTSSLLILNHYIGYSNLENARFYDKACGPVAVSYFKRNIGYGKHLDSLDPSLATTVAASYMNLCYTLPALDFIDPHEALALTDDFEAFIQANDSHFTDQMRERFHSYLNRIRTTSFRINSERLDKADPTDQQLMRRMYEASPYINCQLSDLPTFSDSISYFHAKHIMGEVSTHSAYQECNALFHSMLRRMTQQAVVTDSDVQDIANAFNTTLLLMDQCDLPESEKSHRTIADIHSLIALIQRAKITGDATFFNYMLAKLACDESIVRRLPTEMKEVYLNELAVKSQIGTVAHVNMVEKLCILMLERFIQSCPEQFVGLFDCNSVTDVQQHTDTLLQYMSAAARFHDLGKNTMAAIVSNNFRRLTDHEFAIIQKHPEMSQVYLDIDPLFARYKDVAFGHHKWYNGQGGYPASFDNTASPWRSIIDLLTLCDCIDAATDYFGRNYRSVKKLPVVLQEFINESGTRYNPVMVEALVHDQELIERIEEIITVFRTQEVLDLRKHYLKGE